MRRSTLAFYNLFLLFLLSHGFLIAQTAPLNNPGSQYSNKGTSASKVSIAGEPYEVVLSPYKTTMLGDGKDIALIKIIVMDRQGREIPDANHLITFKVEGDAQLIKVSNADPDSKEPEAYANGEEWKRSLYKGKAEVLLKAGKTVGAIRFEARATGLQPGTTDIFTVQPGAPTSVLAIQHSFPISKGVGRPAIQMLGADISFLPQLESRGVKFSDKGQEKDALEILKDHGFNYIRLRLFNNPAADSGYSPGRGFCDLSHTLQIAKRIKAAGMKLLLDFHYSDTWADPGKQFKPSAWKGKTFPELTRAVYDYTKEVMEALEKQETLPDMVQVGNEINHGMIWPEGKIGNLDSLAQLIYAGINGVKAVDPASTIMLHVALGGQNEESRFFYDNMLLRDVPFDVIGLSYYPKWHCTLKDLEYNANDMANRYKKDVIIVEYSHKKKEVNKIGFSIANGRGKGTCIWEPLNTWEKIFERDGKSNELLAVYDEISQTFIQSPLKK